MAKKKDGADRKDTIEDIKGGFAKRGLHLMTGSELETSQHIRRPFGLPSVDAAIGGGAGGGAVTVLFGPENAGKTLFTTWCLAEAQKTYGKKFKGLVLSLGLPMDKPFARLRGLRIPFSKGETERFIALYTALHGGPPSKQEIHDAGDSIGEVHFLVVEADQQKSMEVALEGFIQLVSTNEYQVAVVDDVGANAPSDLIEFDMGSKGDPKRGYYARLMTIFMQKLQKYLQYSRGSFNSTSVIMTSQVRMDQGSGKQTLPFGKCLRHNIATAIQLKKGKPDDDKESAGTSDQNIISWVVTKGKYGHCEGGRGQLLFSPTFGVDTFMDLAKTAVLYEVVQQRGAYFYISEEERVQGYEALANWLHSEPERFDRILSAVMSKRGIVR